MGCPELTRESYIIDPEIVPIRSAGFLSVKMQPTASLILLQLSVKLSRTGYRHR